MTFPRFLAGAVLNKCMTWRPGECTTASPITDKGMQLRLTRLIHRPQLEPNMLLVSGVTQMEMRIFSTTRQVIDLKSKIKTTLSMERYLTSTSDGCGNSFARH